MFYDNETRDWVKFLWVRARYYRSIYKEPDDFFEPVRRRYENGSIIITTNRPLRNGVTLVIASAIIDRLVHNSHICK